MKLLKFKTSINASKEKVWSTLWNDTTYRQWTSAFTTGSHAVSDWNEGSKINFLDGNGSGMFSIIDKKVENQQMIFKHLGDIVNGTEVITEWSGAKENYLLSENNGVTELTVTLDTADEYVSYMTDSFPKALALLKEITEK